MGYVITIQTITELKDEINRLKMENEAIKRSRWALSDELEYADRMIADLKADVADAAWIVASVLIKFGLLLNNPC